MCGFRGRLNGFALKSRLQNSKSNTQTPRQVLLSSSCHNSVREPLLRVFHVWENEELLDAQIFGDKTGKASRVTITIAYAATITIAYV